jgi:hypothetical protein
LIHESRPPAVPLPRIFFAAVLAVALPLAPAIALAPTGTAAAQTSGGVRLEADPEVGGVGIRLFDVPVATQDDPRAQRYIIDNLPPGTTIERRVQVANETDTTQTVSVYTGSAHIDDGSFIGDKGDTQNELTSWTSLSEPEVTLAAGETTEVLVTVAVPLDAAEGEQYAAIWAQVSAPGQDDATVHTASRVGVRMYVAVGPGNGPAADFSIGAVEAGRTDAGVPQVTASVTNTGGRAVDVSGSLALSDGPSALSAGPFLTEKALTLAPGEEGTVVVSLGNDLPDGPWNATLTLSSGLLVHEATAEVTFPEAGEAVVVEAETDAPVDLIPLAIGGAGLLLLLGLGTLLWLRRRRLKSRVISARS